MSLQEDINYRKLMKLHLLKAYNNIEPSFQQNVIQQMNKNYSAQTEENKSKESINNYNNNIQNG